MTHEIKILEQYAGPVYCKDKTFEVRQNDRGYQKGDIVRFKVMTKGGINNTYHPLNGKEYEITYVLSGWGLQEGWVVFGIREIKGVEK